MSIRYLFNSFLAVPLALSPPVHVFLPPQSPKLEAQLLETVINHYIRYSKQFEGKTFFILFPNNTDPPDDFIERITTTGFSFYKGSSAVRSQSTSGSIVHKQDKVQGILITVTSVKSTSPTTALVHIRYDMHLLGVGGATYTLELKNKIWKIKAYEKGTQA